jgi:hypothetical protein
MLQSSIECKETKFVSSPATSYERYKRHNTRHNSRPGPAHLLARYRSAMKELRPDADHQPASHLASSASVSQMGMHKQATKSNATHAEK